jgi:hypothetical protein
MLDANKIDYKIIKSKKYKRITISIKRSQDIVVSAPSTLSNRKIAEFVKKNETWINKNLVRLEEDLRTKRHTFLDGDKFLFLGELYTLKIIELNNSKKNIFIYRDEKTKELIIYLDEINKEKIKNAIFDYYKKETLYIVKKTFKENLVMQRFENKINTIKVQKSNTRWGSCSSKNNLNFSFRLIMLPRECVEYVMLHELAHIKEKNHGPFFYIELGILCPNYKELEQKLKQISKTYNVSLA